MPRFYVTMTWDGFPEGGSYGTVLEAADQDEAEKLCRLEMADARAGDDPDDPEDTATYYLEHYGDSWEVIDCYDLDSHLLHHMLPLHKAAPDLLMALKDLQAQLHAHVKMDVKKHFRLMVADAAANTAIAKAEG